jgi:hypothetical protein
MINRITVAVAVILIGWAYMAIKPPPPKICGSINGPPVTSPRVKLSDGRHLAYREFGFPKDEARYKIIIVHGYGSSKDTHLPVSQVRICSCYLLLCRTLFSLALPNSLTGR